MQLKKQVLNEKEKRELRFPSNEAIERICDIADSLEAYLQLAYEEGATVEEVIEFLDAPELIVGIPPAQQNLRDYAAHIYTHARALQFVEKKVYFDGKTFIVEVFITATPF